MMLVSATIAFLMNLSKALLEDLVRPVALRDLILRISSLTSSGAVNLILGTS